MVSAPEKPDPMGSSGAQIVPQGWSCLEARCPALLVLDQSAIGYKLPGEGRPGGRAIFWGRGWSGDGRTGLERIQMTYR